MCVCGHVLITRLSWALVMGVLRLQPMLIVGLTSLCEHSLMHGQVHAHHDSHDPWLLMATHFSNDIVMTAPLAPLLTGSSLDCRAQLISTLCSYCNSQCLLTELACACVTSMPQH